MYEPKEIETNFRNYYKNLCSQPPSATTEQTKAFLQTLNLPAIGKKQNSFLTSRIERSEIEAMVRMLQNVLWTTYTITWNNLQSHSWKRQIATILGRSCDISNF